MTDNRKKWERVRDEMWGDADFYEGFDVATKYWLERAEKLVGELRKALPHQPKMDGKDSWTHCQKIVDRAIAEWAKEVE